MQNDSTLLSPADSSVTVDYPETTMHPKRATLERIRSFARAAFSAPGIDNLPVIVLN